MEIQSTSPSVKKFHLDTRLSFIQHISVCFWCTQFLSSPLQILRRKMRRDASSRPSFHHDFSLREINGWCWSPPVTAFIGALLFSISLKGPVVHRRHVRTDYTPARHCSVPNRGFELSGRTSLL